MPRSEAPFRTSRTPIFEDLRVARVALSPGATFRDETLIKDGNTSFVLMIAQSRQIDVAHRDRELLLAHGDATLVSMARTGTFGSSGSYSFVPVVIPYPELEARASRPDDLTWRRTRRSSDALRLLVGYLRSLRGTRLDERPQGRAVVRRHILDLAALVVTPHAAIGESNLTAVAAARRAAALDQIAAFSGEPELNLATVARSQGVSPRYLQRLFQASGSSFTAEVNELRLQRALALLTGAGADRRRIADIAFDAGFSDISHFNRLFRARFGDTPRGVRGQTR